MEEQVYSERDQADQEIFENQDYTRDFSITLQLGKDLGKKILFIKKLSSKIWKIWLKGRQEKIW